MHSYVSPKLNLKLPGPKPIIQRKSHFLPTDTPPPKYMNSIEDKEVNHTCFYYIILAQDFMQKSME